MHMLPGSDLTSNEWWVQLHFDKLLHFGAFTLCALTWVIAMAKRRWVGTNIRLFWLLIGSSAIFGMVLEGCQGAWMPGRMFDLVDVIADVVGALSSMLVFRFIFGHSPGRIATD